MKLELLKQEKFNEVLLDFYQNEDDEIFMTVSQLAQVLGYSSKGSLESLVSRNPRVKESEFSVVTRMQATDGKSYRTRVFTEDGIYEVAMLSKRPEASKFREFVRKLLKGLRKGELKLEQTVKNNIDPIEQARIWAQNFEKSKALH